MDTDDVSAMCEGLRMMHPHVWEEGWCRHCGDTTELDRTVTDGAIHWRPLPDGYEVTVYAMTFGKARLNYGTQGPMGSIENGFCYQDPRLAIQAAHTWTGEGDPIDGWHRNPFDGRRREGGDPAKEETRA